MSIKDTIKSLEEADEKLKRATETERKALVAQKDAARLREESQRDLEAAQIERNKSQAISEAMHEECKRSDQDLKNREAKLAAGLAGLINNTAESNKNFDTKHAALDARSVVLDKRERVVEASIEDLNKRANKYADIEKFISDRL